MAQKCKLSELPMTIQNWYNNRTHLKEMIKHIYLNTNTDDFTVTFKNGVKYRWTLRCTGWASFRLQD